MLQNVRLIGQISGKSNGPVILIIAGLHGNEPTGIEAAKQWIESLRLLPQDSWKGHVYAFLGNTLALEQNARYLDFDLNRMWTHKHINDAKSSKISTIRESKDLIELHDEIENVLANHTREAIYLVDLHTTSGATPPFLAVMDTISNRKVLHNAPYRKILGLEENIYGSLTEFYKDRVKLSVAFEAGQNEDPASVKNHIEFLHWLQVKIGSLKSDLPVSLQVEHASNKAWYELVYSHLIDQHHRFVMLPNRSSFEWIEEGNFLASDINGKVLSPKSGFLFMPLYQKFGSEGFSILKPVSPIQSFLSRFLRKLNAFHLLAILPGISRLKGYNYAWCVSENTHALIPRSLMRLIGIRKRRRVKSGWVYSKNEIEDYML
jgi:succinylglutamate desuccinylase